MLYERKRTFGRGPIELKDAVFAMVGETGASAAVYAGSLGLSATPATAGTLDYEEDNQHFPEENTVEFIGWEDADSAADGATLTVTIQSSSDGAAWKDEVEFALVQGDIKKDGLIRRFTIPSQAFRHMRLKLVGGVEAFTAGKILALARPL
ncbi:MAG: hypothetical protein EOM68_06660 [Spirochaetia bacterium]|nr:hypothetical protein [Spirochaetia bacterium]